MLELSGIDKSFGAVHANKSVDLTLRHKEILGLLGENGAGKTTLMNVLFGIYSADAGVIRIDGRPAAIHGPADALAAGIGMVHQHFHLVPRHSVLENLMVGRGAPWGLCDRAGTRARLEEIGRRYSLGLDPERLVGSLSIGEQQRLEIVKALFRGARILILDEPTSVLTPQETEGLFAAIRAMAAAGVGIIFISHKLGEVRAITSRLVVMRQGAVQAVIEDVASVTDRELAQLMCGHDLAPTSKEPSPPGRALLTLEGICTAAAPGHPVALEDVSLRVHSGEILGIAGVSGNGQRELAETIAGMLAPLEGRLEVDGRVVKRPNPRLMQRLGVAQIPEDRIGDGLLTTLPLGDSMVLSRIGDARFSRFGILKQAAIRDFVIEQIEAFDIKAAGPGVRTGTLSGGNLQKALLARELAFEPLVLVAAQPTRGLDVAAKAFVHKQFLNLRARGRGVIVISEDLEELFEIADRIAVMYEGRVVDVLPAAEADVARIGLLMAGAAP
ncbi:MAG: ABC transporter ATP-binding protein [Proteobacteria bacterium]|nr:ABC transporter ATP-binding protein [Pseudomonadota bacterium]